MRYIRRIDDPLQILAFGYVPSGGLGEFDPTLYEEVEGELPENWELEQPLTLEQQLSQIFEAQSEDLQADFSTLRAAVKLELDLGRPHIAQKIIVRASIPGELESIRQVLLNCFPESDTP